MTSGYMSQPSTERRNSAAKWSLSTIPEDQVPIPGHQTWPQHVAALSGSLIICLAFNRTEHATLVSMVGGMVLAWSSPMLDHLPPKWTLSWVASIAPLGALLGAILSSWFVGHIGRRPLLILLVIPNLIGWGILIGAAVDVRLTLLYIGRFLTGVSAGGATVVVPLYSSEIAEPAIRGIVGVYLDLSMTVGILLAYFVGAVAGDLTPVAIASLGAALSIAAAVAAFAMPESPAYLIAKNRRADARMALLWLRTGDRSERSKGWTGEAGLNRELDAAQREVVAAEERVLQMGGNFGLLKTLWSSSATGRAVRIVVVLMALQQLSGIDAVIFYLEEILEDSAETLNPAYSSVFVGAVQVAATLVAAMLVERAGRRLLLAASGSLMAASLVALVVYYLFHENLQVDLKSYDWLPVTSLSVFVFVYCIGFGPLPFLMMAEFLPVEAKSFGCALATCVNWTLMFVVTRSFTMAFKSAQYAAAVFGAFCAICVLGTLFVVTLVPETQGKTPTEIRQDVSDREIHVVPRRLSTPGGII